MFAGTVTAGSGVTIYTVPTGFTFILRDAYFRANGNATDVTLYRASGVHVAAPTPSSVLASGDNGQWVGRATFDAGETILAFCAGANVDISITGYLFAIS